MNALFFDKNFDPTYKPKISSDPIQIEKIKLLIDEIKQCENVYYEFYEHAKSTILEKPTIFISGWRYIPQYNLNERERYKDKILIKELIKRLTQEIYNKEEEKNVQ